MSDGHYVAATLGAVDVKLTHSTTGVALEVDAKRPRAPGETEAEAMRASVAWALAAYDEAVAQLEERGLVPGPHKKPEAKP